MSNYIYIMFRPWTYMYELFRPPTKGVRKIAGATWGGFDASTPGVMRGLPEWQGARVARTDMGRV